MNLAGAYSLQALKFIADKQKLTFKLKIDKICEMYG